MVTNDDCHCLDGLDTEARIAFRINIFILRGMPESEQQVGFEKVKELIELLKTEEKKVPSTLLEKVVDDLSNHDLGERIQNAIIKAITARMLENAKQTHK